MMEVVYPPPPTNRASTAQVQKSSACPILREAMRTQEVRKKPVLVSKAKRLLREYPDQLFDLRYNPYCYYRKVGQTNNDVGALFAATDNLLLAVALLRGHTHGENLTNFWKPLQNKPCPLAKEKLQMLLSGSFRGIPLICDHYRDKRNREDPVEWYPSKQNARRFFRQIGKNMTNDEWIVAFPQTLEHVLPIMIFETG